jgi:putative flippase GtrA
MQTEVEIAVAPPLGGNRGCLTGRPGLTWFTAPVERVILQLPRALIASGLAALVDLALLVGLVEVMAIPPLGAATVSYLVGGLLQYYLCAVWVFPTAPRNAATGFAAFTLLSLFGLGITWGVMAVLHSLLHANYALAKVVALGLAFCWNFLSRKYLLFKQSAS